LGPYALSAHVQSHFVTFCCYHRRPLFTTDASRRIFENALERVRRSFCLRVYGYVVMPEHIHLLVSEPERTSPLKPTPGLNGPPSLADALKSLKQGVARRLIGERRPLLAKALLRFQRSQSCAVYREAPLHSLQSGEAGIVSATRRLAVEQLSTSHNGAARDELKSSPNGTHASVSERREGSVQLSNCPTQAKIRLEWATRPTWE
jgi:REP element-mobilizing transposase RayT